MKGSSAVGFNNQQYLILFMKNVLIRDLLKQGRLQLYVRLRKVIPVPNKEPDTAQKPARMQRFAPNTDSCSIQSKSSCDTL